MMMMTTTATMFKDDDDDDDDDDHNRDDDVTSTVVYQRKFPFSCAFQTWAKWTLIYCVVCKSKFYLKVTKKSLFVCPREQQRPLFSNSVCMMMLHFMCLAACFTKFLALVGLHDIEPPPAASNSQIPMQV